MLSPVQSIFSPAFFLLYITGFPNNVICNIAIYAANITLFSEFDPAIDLWYQLELASEPESELQDTVD